MLRFLLVLTLLSVLGFSCNRKVNQAALEDDWGEGVHDKKLKDDKREGPNWTFIATTAALAYAGKKINDHMEKTGFKDKMRAKKHEKAVNQACYKVIKHSKKWLDAAERIRYSCLTTGKEDSIYYRTDMHEWCWDSLPCTVHRPSSDKLIRHLCKCKD